MGVVYIGIGLPGSGKTPKLIELAAEHNAVYVCPDDMRSEASERMTLRELWAEAYQRIYEALARGCDVVVNATNAKAVDRRQLIQHVYGGAEEVVGMWFTTDVEVCLLSTSVPEHAMRRMDYDLRAHPPGEADGFDRIIQVAA